MHPHEHAPSSPLAPSPPQRHAQQTPLYQLTLDQDLHVRELAFAAFQYAATTAEHPNDYDALYNHGLVLQELSGRMPTSSADQIGLLRQVSFAVALMTWAHAHHMQHVL